VRFHYFEIGHFLRTCDPRWHLRWAKRTLGMNVFVLLLYVARAVHSSEGNRSSATLLAGGWALIALLTVARVLVLQRQIKNSARFQALFDSAARSS
jgi:hypothetical protein